MRMTNIQRRYFALAGTLIAAGGLAFAMAPAAHASTHACDIAGNGCRSIQSEVPNRPDLDVQGGAKVVGNVLIVYTRSATDKAEDFRVVSHAATDTSTAAVGTLTTSTQLGTRVSNAVEIRYAPFGVDSGLCLSSVNPNGFASVQLRNCNAVSGKFNPWQTFGVDDTGIFDGQFVKYIEPIYGFVMTNPANNGSIGTVGHRIQVRFAHANGTTGQLWGKNNS